MQKWLVTHRPVASMPFVANLNPFVNLLNLSNSCLHPVVQPPNLAGCASGVVMICIQADASNAPPSTVSATFARKLDMWREYVKVGELPRPSLITTQPPHAAMVIHVEPPLEEEVLPNVNASIVSDLPAFEPAPTVHVELLSLNGQASVQVLPDSGADISVAGRALLSHLHEHPDNLLPSNVTPHAVNGSLMRPIGRLPVTITLGTAVYAEDFHIYPDVSTTLLS